MNSTDTVPEEGTTIIVPSIIELKEQKTNISEIKINLKTKEGMDGIVIEQYVIALLQTRNNIKGVKKHDVRMNVWSS